MTAPEIFHLQLYTLRRLLTRPSPAASSAAYMFAVDGVLSRAKKRRLSIAEELEEKSRRPICVPFVTIVERLPRRINLEAGLIDPLPEAWRLYGMRWTLPYGGAFPRELLRDAPLGQRADEHNWHPKSFPPSSFCNRRCKPSQAFEVSSYHRRPL